MKTLLNAVVLLLAAAAVVCQARPTTTEPQLIELVHDPDVVDDERLSISYPNCRSWHLAVETRNIPKFDYAPANCLGYISSYMNYDQYQADSKTVCKEAYFYAKGLALKNDTINAWIFDVDETLLSNIPYYATHGYGTRGTNEQFEPWLKKGEAPVLPETLHLYKNLVYKVGLKPILISERDESLKNVTLANLEAAGYHYWERVIFKPSGSKKLNVNFKSSERKKLAKSGYNLIGNIGDQWSDLMKDIPGRRTFKLPNPMYVRA